MPTEILEGVFDITARKEAERRYRTFLFVEEVAILVDAGFAETAATVFDGIAEIGAQPDRLIITHGHGDHIGGMDAMVERYGVETWLPNETEIVGDHEPDHRFGDGDRIGRFVAVHLPGHAADSYALIDEDAGIAVLGDALSGADQRGLSAGYFHLPPGPYSESLNEAEASLERLLAFEFDVGLVYHGSSVTTDARAKLDRYVNFPGKPDRSA